MEVSLCVTSMDSERKDRIYPVELKFPANLKREDKERINKALEKVVYDLGFEPTWIPVL